MVSQGIGRKQTTINENGVVWDGMSGNLLNRSKIDGVETVIVTSTTNLTLYPKDFSGKKVRFIGAENTTTDSSGFVNVNVGPGTNGSTTQMKRISFKVFDGVTLSLECCAPSDGTVTSSNGRIIEYWIQYDGIITYNVAATNFTTTPTEGRCNRYYIACIQVSPTITPTYYITQLNNLPGVYILNGNQSQPFANPMQVFYAPISFGAIGQVLCSAGGNMMSPIWKNVYQHNINMQIRANLRLSFNIINASENPFNKTSMSEYLTEIGYIAGNKMTASGVCRPNSSSEWGMVTEFVPIYGTNEFRVGYVIGSADVAYYTAAWSSINTFTDVWKKIVL